MLTLTLTTLLLLRPSQSPSSRPRLSSACHPEVSASSAELLTESAGTECSRVVTSSSASIPRVFCWRDYKKRPSTEPAVSRAVVMCSILATTLSLLDRTLRHPDRLAHRHFISFLNNNLHWTLGHIDQETGTMMHLDSLRADGHFKWVKG